MRKGFTLIELLLVVVIIGIVAALVLPKFGDVKQKAYIAAMKSDLRNFATAQEIYFDNAGSYAASTADADFATSDNVTIAVTTPFGGDDNAYEAVASHGKVDGTQCSIQMGPGLENKVACAATVTP